MAGWALPHDAGTWDFHISEDATSKVYAAAKGGIMMHDMMGGMMWGMGLIGLLLVVVLVLAILALSKYLFRSGR
jgi:uncharacterized membrane protein